MDALDLKHSVSGSKTSTFFRWLFGVNKIINPLIQFEFETAPAFKYQQQLELKHLTASSEQQLSNCHAFVLWLCGINPQKLNLTAKANSYISNARAGNQQKIGRQYHALDALLSKQVGFIKAHVAPATPNALTAVDHDLAYRQEKRIDLQQGYNSERSSSWWINLHKSGQRIPSSTMAENNCRDNYREIEALQKTKKHLINRAAWQTLLTSVALQTEDTFNRYRQYLREGSPKKLIGTHPSIEALLIKQVDYIAEHRNCLVQEIKELQQQISDSTKQLRFQRKEVWYSDSYETIENKIQYNQSLLNETQQLKAEASRLFSAQHTQLPQTFDDAETYIAFMQN
ncbi:MAG: hypothetical protein K0U24_00850 [Gammaproteobacteria bacterium]|nr:hypothetical protein [Gammaproteobacteria bacterium]